MPTPHDKPNNDPGRDPAQRSQIPPPYFHSAHIVPPQLPPETYTYPPPPSNYGPPWPPSTASQIPSASVAGPSSFYPTNPMMPLPPHAVPQSMGSLQYLPSSVASPTTVAAAQDPEDAMSIDEDKRRRNTAASARFRVKRKMKTLNLERTVADLSGRTEELEQEANDLRRENTWLKEIVLLKGRNLAALNRGSGVPLPSNRQGEDEDDRTHESQVKRGGKEKSKETDPGNV